ncbi:MAG: DUF1573 domain-containing protein, partial [Thermoguttaceae bacterium]|nr:DUF1573 domain-containing protein [Thermoguttaceae bacterium]
RNAGHADLLITRVVPDCGCTTAKVSKNVLAPGDEVAIAATLSFKAIRGPTAKRIVIETNDPRRRHAVLLVRGRGEPELSVEPGEIWVDTHVEPGTEIAAIRIGALKQETTFDIKRVESDAPFFAVSVERSGVPCEFRVRLRLTDKLPTDPAQAHVVVQTNHPRESVVLIPVRFRVGQQ